MKKTQEILGLPIISISDGNEVGRVKSIIINADKGAIDYIVVDNGIQILAARVIPSDSVQGIGEYALTVEDEGTIKDISTIPAAIDLLQKDIKVKGTRVMTRKGQLIGETGDIFVNEDDCCRITGLEFVAEKAQGKVRIIPRDNVITFGKNLIVVTENVESALLDNHDQLGAETVSSEVEKKNQIVSDIVEPEETAFAEADIETEGSTTVSEVKEDTFENGFDEEAAIPAEEVLLSETEEEIFPEMPAEEREETFSHVAYEEGELQVEAEFEIEPEAEIEVEEPKVVEQAPAEEDKSAANLFEQRQRQYLVGRKSTKTITDNSGNVIVNDGMLINDSVIDAAKNCGKLIELVMNNKA